MLRCQLTKPAHPGVGAVVHKQAIRVAAHHYMLEPPFARSVELTSKLMTAS